MKTGYRGTFVITWLQTEVDGLTGVPAGAIHIGSTWRWSGRATRVDDTRDILVLEGAENIEETRRRAAAHVGRILGNPNYTPPEITAEEDDQPLFGAGFDVTDGHELYRATLIDLEGSLHPMLLFVGAMPPADQDLWVVDQNTEKRTTPSAETAGVICFVPGTRIETPDGATLVEELQPGDRVNTKDNGVQDIRWIGRRHMSGSRLVAMPHMRPIRLRSHFFDLGQPDPDLILSPDHRIVVKGRAAQDLFNTPEVLVAARDLVNDHSVTIDHSHRTAEYIHLMLDSHQIVWANGVECESFHPANATLDQIETTQRFALMEQFPTVADNPYDYGDFVRRNLTQAEAAILSYGGFSTH
jgi:hypothetical protein